MMDNYSLSDIKAVTDGNESGFGGGAWWIIVLFLFMFRGGAGFDGNGATAATQHEILLGQQFETIGNKLNSIGDGLCNGFYSLNNSVMSEGRALQGQIAECCCENRLGIANLGAHIDQAVGQITNMFKDSKIESLQSQVADLRLRDAMCGVVRYPTQMAYTTNCNPFVGCGGCGSYQPNI